MSWIKSRILSSIPGVVHGFGHRDSGGTERIAGAFGLKKVARLKQVHGSRIVFTDDEEIFEPPAPEGDGLINTSKGLGVAAASADCVPILFADESGTVTAAVHAGWRGTLAGISAEVLRLIDERYGVPPSRMRAVIGPSIKLCCYEVGEDVASLFLGKFGPDGGYLHEKGDGKYMLDLPRMNGIILERSGAGAMETLSHCTKCDGSFYSYRREGKGVPSQLSFIGLL
ncbi:MAG TPA: peptidoglycan editing factor PgeF [Thermodesulfobacteriota bacterium]|nr:peptidoglycan editing factor PgeF [Thermodesulfobacteriota bacterium]